MTADAPPTAVCAHCRTRVPVRVAASGTVRLTRHDVGGERSCPGTGAEVRR